MVSDLLLRPLMILTMPLWRLWPALGLFRKVLRGRCDRRETIAQVEAFGYRSIGIVVAAGMAVGGIVAVHAAGYVAKYSAGDLAGWAVGYAVLREVGPLLTGLLLAGRVGAMNAAELADMSVRGQLRALEATGLDPLSIVIAPRVYAAMLSGLALFSVAAVTALLTAVLGVTGATGLKLMPFLYALHDGVELSYLFVGLFKAVVFSVIVASLSTFEGLQARGGSDAVGRVVNNAAVACAVGIVVANFIITLVLP
jgi:phospholipid/cholesterol/gamma-HCH transport system permease protein